MTKDEIVVANKDLQFPTVFYYHKEPLAVAHAKNQYEHADVDQFIELLDHGLAACESVTSGRAT